MEKTDFYTKYSSLPEDIRGVVDALLMHAFPEEVNSSSWITVSEAAEIMGISGQTVRLKIKEGIIPFRNSSQRKTVVDRVTVERLAQTR